MTDREKEILAYISQNPRASQQELADKFGITRSSVAVHISNLIKKGIIRGKEYVIERKPYITIIGGLNVDIHGKPFGELLPFDSLPGIVSTGVGGVGMNISANLSALGESVKFISATGDDNYRSRISEYCKLHSVDLAHSLAVQDAKTATYLYITDADGEMQLAIADMAITEYITPEYIQSKLHTINYASLCVIDTNIPQKSIDFIAKHCKVPLFADAVSTKKAVKLTGVLDKLHALKCNELEAETLSGVRIDDLPSAYTAAKKLIDLGVKNIFITLGSRGIVYASASKCGTYPIYKTIAENSTGAGDSCMAAIIWGFRNGLNISESAKAGNACASICIESEDTLNPELTQDFLKKRMSFIN